MHLTNDSNQQERVEILVTNKTEINNKKSLKDSKIYLPLLIAL
jgi:hypothetical protein